MGIDTKNAMDLVNSFFVLPALKAGIERNIWDNEEEELSPIKEIWRNLGLLKSRGGLTPLGFQIKELHSLISYFSSIRDDFFSYSPHRLYSIQEYQYEMLRKGLGQFQKNREQNPFRFYEFIPPNAKGLKVLDYCGGNGQYLLDFIEENPTSTGLLVDRNPWPRDEFETAGIQTKAVDFEMNPDWYKEHIDEFDVIILSEILHCKGPAGRQYLLDTCKHMCKAKGVVFINEIVPSAIFDWRMRMYTKEGKSVSIDEIRSMAEKDWHVMVPDKQLSEYHYSLFLVNGETE